jgi:hypothetical protein
MKQVPVIKTKWAISREPSIDASYQVSL